MRVRELTLSGADKKANVSWTAWQGFWSQRGVPLQRRLRVFRAVIRGSLLSGLEAWCPTASGVQLLERSLCKKLRYLLLGDDRGKSNDWLRTHCNMPTMDSCLLQRRLMFFFTAS